MTVSQNNDGKQVKSTLDDRIKHYEGDISKLDDRIRLFTIIAWGAVIIGFIVGILGVFNFLFTDCFPILKMISLNELGDYLAGSVASFWSLAGLFFIYIAFLGQKQQMAQQQIELAFNQQELQETRKVLDDQKNQMFEQNRTLQIQRFENTFFNLLNNHQQIVTDMDIKHPNSHANITSGRDCFKRFYSLFSKRITAQDDNAAIIEKYEEFYFQNQGDFGHYYKVHYRILKFVKSKRKHNILDDEEMKEYTAILRAHLSSYELVFLYINSLSKYGKDKHAPLLDYFDMFKNLDIEIPLMRQIRNNIPESR